MNWWAATYLAGVLAFGLLLARGIHTGQFPVDEAREDKYPGIIALVSLLLALAWPLLVGLFVYWRVRRRFK